MKRLLSLLMVFALLGSTSAYAAGAPDGMTKIQGSLEAPIECKSVYPDNPVIEGESPTTGLPASGEAFTPILVTIDNSEDAHPHWGVGMADVMFQIPNAGSGATKLLALFADQYPEQAGGVRSARATMLPLAMAFDAAFAHAGGPSIENGNSNPFYLMKEWGMKSGKRTYDMLGKNYRERVNFIKAPHNLSCHVREIHEHLVDENVTFDMRPFRFTDEPRTDGIEVTSLMLLHHGDDAANRANNASTSTFEYHPELNAYIRSNVDGEYIDRDSAEAIPFANVIVLRIKFSWIYKYVYLSNHLTGSGCIEIFQNGRYVQGAWMRKDLNSRLVLIGPDGEELALQRGKTFIVVTNDVTEVFYQ